MIEAETVSLWRPLRSTRYAHGGGQRITYPIRRILLPRGGRSVRRVVYAPDATPAEMTRMCRSLGVSAALSWLASRSAELGA